MASFPAQLDLFIDSRAVVLANEVISALLARDASRSVNRLDDMRRSAPDHPRLPALETLVNTLAGWQAPVPETVAIARLVAELEKDVAPAAEVALGVEATVFIGGFFRELASAAQGLSYAPAYLAAHRAALCLRCGDFFGAEQAALAIPDWNAIPDALHWLTVARYRLGGVDAARATLFGLAWRLPGRLPIVLAELADDLLDRDWQSFEQSCDWEHVPESDMPAWFPAWYLVEHPATGKSLDGAAFPDTVPADASRTLLRLFDLERQGNSRALVGLRSHLRSLNPGLFALYMARRTVRHD
jgi:hypothetical protein